MNKKALLWILPAIVAAAAIVVYRSAADAAKDAAIGDATTTPMMVSHAGPTEKEHEIKALLGELKKNPAHLPILLRLAQVSRDSGKLDDAVGYLQQAAAENPQNADASLELGRALFDTGDVTGAIRATEHVLEINPSNTDALYNLGAIYGNLSQDQRAREYWQRIVTLAPDSESGRRAKNDLQKLR
jgi:Flp pilus assembly protein TadD